MRVPVFVDALHYGLNTLFKVFFSYKDATYQFNLYRILLINKRESSQASVELLAIEALFWA